MTKTAASPAPTVTYRKHACGFCAAGLHHLCKVATWNPGSGKIVIPAAGGQPAVYSGEALWCACPDPECEGKRPSCRECGYDPGFTLDLGEGLVCLDRAECALRVSQRLENDPIHLLLLECRTTRIVDGEAVERPRRATPAEQAAAKAAKAAARARGCLCCGESTKGGLFLPGHDARFVAVLAGKVRAGEIEADEAQLALADCSPALQAKLAKRLAGGSAV